MLRAQGLRRVYRSEWWIFTATAISLLTLILFPRLLRGRTEGFLHPHGYCYLWDRALVTSHVGADLLIGVAYVAISMTLAYLVYRVRHLLPFHWMFLAFGLFILTCGATHFMDVWTLWFADFWASAALKIVTAVASVATALALPPVIPQVVRLLHAANVSEQRGAQLEAERKIREEAQAQSQARDLFLATLSHELRTPLNAMSGWTHVLQRAEDAQTRQKAVEAIQRNVALQTRLVEDMLDVSAILTRQLALKVAHMDLAAVVREAAEPSRGAAAAKGLQFALHLPDAPVYIQGDEARLHQVVSNVLSNAIKFTERGGVTVTVTAHAGMAVIRVSDTGMGIDPLFLPKVFDVFAQADQSSTRSTGGLGLGLAIVRHLVERHGGRVQAESNGSGSGTVVEIHLPISGPAAVQ